MSSVQIALVGKYTEFRDAYTSVVKALEHAAILCSKRLELIFIASSDLEVGNASRETSGEWRRLATCGGIIVPGGFGRRGVQGKILAIEYARINRLPFLGICLGFQCAVIEYCRNVLRLPGANSTEIEPNCLDPVIIEMPEHNPDKKGATMRLGRKRSFFVESYPSITRELYMNAQVLIDQKFIEERHRHRYEVNLDYAERIQSAGMRFVAVSLDQQRMELLELDKDQHPYFVATQFHPEYLSRPLKPSPVYAGFIAHASKVPTKSLHFNYSDVDLHAKFRRVNSDGVDGSRVGFLKVNKTNHTNQ